MADSLLHLTSANFASDALNAPLPILVDFWAPWCGPCKAIAPVLDELARDLAGKLIVGKLNVDEAGEIAAQYSVRAIPTLILFKGGQVVDQYVGLVDKATLRAKVAAKL